MPARNFWIIGDIHGELSLLESLLESIARWQPERIVFLGDYIDRGPHSRQVVDRIMELGEKAVALMGNHEWMMMNALEDRGWDGSPIELWYYNGGETTLLSFGFSSFFSFRSDLPDRYRDFFARLRMSHLEEPVQGMKILALHAGISPSISLEDQLSLAHYHDLHRYIQQNQVDPGDTFLWVREAFFRSDGTGWKGHLVVHGHTPVMKLQRFARSFNGGGYHFIDNDLCIRRHPVGERILSLDIDSGSAVSGRLSGVGFFTEQDGGSAPKVRMRSLTVSAGDIFPRDLGLVSVPEEQSEE